MAQGRWGETRRASNRWLSGGIRTRAAGSLPNEDSADRK